MKRDQVIEGLKRFKARSQHKYSILRIGVFGSAARDSMGKDSDLDVVVMLENQDLFKLIGIKQDLEEEFRLPVDVVSYRDKMNQLLKRRIDDEAVYV